MLLRLGLATMVITHSEAVKHKAIERFRIPADRVAVVPLAANSTFHPAATPSDRPPIFFMWVLLSPEKTWDWYSTSGGNCGANILSI